MTTRYDPIMASPANYWLGIAFDTTGSLAAAIAGFWLGPSLAASFAAMLAGIVWYSLCEYAIHRWIYHRGITDAAIVHDRHHAEPATIIGSPFYYSVSIAALHGLAVALVFGPSPALVFAGAMLFSYGQQSLIHHSAHRYPHLDVLGRRSRLRRHHALHHAVGTTNFGVSTTLWDRLLGTYR